MASLRVSAIALAAALACGSARAAEAAEPQLAAVTPQSPTATARATRT
ncbi:MAG: hypothetical protein HY021_01835 [Burkholderiales bacterium]|nr:hypothetical protein [Burkholderiales bacterium]